MKSFFKIFVVVLCISLLACSCRQGPADTSSYISDAVETVIIDQTDNSAPDAQSSEAPPQSTPTASAPDEVSFSSVPPVADEDEEIDYTDYQTYLDGPKPYKLNIEGGNTHIADPHVFRDDDGKFYMYITGGYVYTADTLKGVWKNRTAVGHISGRSSIWAPCLYKENGVYYLYYSSAKSGENYAEQRLFVLKSNSPTGPFTDPKQLYGEIFTIDPHVVKTSQGILIFYSANKDTGKNRGTRIFVDKLKDPYTPANICKEILAPSMIEEISQYYSSSEPWHTLEGAFYIEKDGWQYLMYSGSSYETDMYHIGYAVAKSGSTNFADVKYVKHTKDGSFDPLMFRSQYEEGTGHHSVVEVDGQYYMIYHARDYNLPEGTNMGSARNARMCKLHFNDGVITTESVA